MKLVKLTNVTDIEAAGIAVHLGARKMLYCDSALLNPAQISHLEATYVKDGADSIMFDKGAIFDAAAYEIARDCVDQIKENHEVIVAIFNAPEYARKTYTPKAEV